MQTAVLGYGSSIGLLCAFFLDWHKPGYGETAAGYCHCVAWSCIAFD